ncbi:hypothetical protein GCM10007937_05710 [Mesorhizobium albiziae]|nr:hypothetical protein GCM10007937_05710 [Mesorhizobium albiziae]
MHFAFEYSIMQSMGKDQKQQLSLYIKKNTLGEIRTLADRDGRSLSNFVAHVLDEYIEQKKNSYFKLVEVPRPRSEVA